MPNLFARQTALTNIGGRIDYISNPKRQEHLLAVFDGAADQLDGAYWRQLARECKLASKHAKPGTKCVQGREIIIPLSNSLLRRMKPGEIATVLGRSFQDEFGRPCMVAIHFNKDMTNLHAHLIYPERDLLPEPEEKIAPRALFFDENGKRHYKKAAVLDDAGKLRPGCRIVAKGEIYERRFFGAVDQTFYQKGWLKNAKSNWLLPLRNGELRGDVEITEYNKASGKLALQHVGKLKDVDSPEAKEKVARILACNEKVREYNQMVDNDLVPGPVADLIQETVKKKPEKMSVLQGIIDWLKCFIKKWTMEIQQKEIDSGAQKMPLDMKIRLTQQRQQTEVEWKGSMQFIGRLDWRLQERLDAACGTSYAAESKARYFESRKRDPGAR